MARSFVGFDIGTDNVKVAFRDRGLRFLSRRLPENVMNEEGIVSPQVMAEFLKKLRVEEGIRDRDCAIVLTEQRSYFRHVSLPPMTTSELKINLPYEFRDFITEDPDAYAYDYAVDDMVCDEDGRLARMELYASAVRRSVMDTYADILKHAGFRLRVVTPSSMAYMHLMHAHNVEHPEDAGRDVVVVDIGYNQMNISLFEDDRFMGSRVVDSGCVDVDSAIAEMRDVDLHVAGTYRDSNFEGVLDTDRCRSVFDRLVFEVSKVVNFYNFSNPDKDIKGIYLSGGGAAIPQLVSAMGMDFDYPVWYVNAFMPDEVRTRTDNIVCSLAYAALVAGEEASRGA